MWAYQVLPRCFILKRVVTIQLYLSDNCIKRESQSCRNRKSLSFIILHYIYICIDNASLCSFVVLMTIGDRYLLCTGYNDINARIVTISVSPVCLWVGRKLGWKARRILASDWPFSLAFRPVLWSSASMFHLSDSQNRKRGSDNYRLYNVAKRDHPPPSGISKNYHVPWFLQEVGCWP